MEKSCQVIRGARLRMGGIVSFKDCWGTVVMALKGVEVEVSAGREEKKLLLWVVVVARRRRSG